MDVIHDKQVGSGKLCREFINTIHLDSLGKLVNQVYTGKRDNVIRRKLSLPTVRSTENKKRLSTPRRPKENHWIYGVRSHSPRRVIAGKKRVNSCVNKTVFVTANILVWRIRYAITLLNGRYVSSSRHEGIPRNTTERNSKNVTCHAESIQQKN
jgi:hypothetical protein